MTQDPCKKQRAHSEGFSRRSLIEGLFKEDLVALKELTRNSETSRNREQRKTINSHYLEGARGRSDVFIAQASCHSAVGIPHPCIWRTHHRQTWSGTDGQWGKQYSFSPHLSLTMSPTAQTQTEKRVGEPGGYRPEVRHMTHKGGHKMWRLDLGPTGEDGGTQWSSVWTWPAGTILALFTLFSPLVFCSDPPCTYLSSMIWRLSYRRTIHI